MKLFKLKGYIVELDDGRVVNYSASSDKAKVFCAQQNIPESLIKQVYVHEEVIYNMGETQNIELYEPNQNNFLVEAKKETND